MVTKTAEIWSDLPVSPGSVLQEELAARDMTQKELAVRTGRPVQVVNEIVRGKKAITHETALEFEKVLGVSAHIWTNLESIYQMTLAKNKERARLEEQVEWLDHFPVQALETRGWIPRHKDKVEKVRALLEFLGIAGFGDSWSEAAIGFRITGSGRLSDGALSVWLRKGVIDGVAASTERYDESRFLKALHEIKGMTGEQPRNFVHSMMGRCAQAGVAFVLTPELPKSGANGVARWLNPERALIQLSIRWRWADVFWFTFFHEACHVLRHQVRTTFVEGKELEIGDSQAEDEANTFAADILIPSEDWARFLDGGDWSERAVTSLASNIGIHPGIVVGRMQFEGIIPYSRLTHLKPRLEWIDGPQ